MFFTFCAIKKAIREAIQEQEEWAVESERKRHDRELAALKSQIEQSEKKLREVEHNKQMEEKELAHLVKMKEEKITIETKKKELELQEKFMMETAELQKKFHEQTVALLEKHQEKFQHTYEEIMKRLPNVNVDITRGGK